MPSACYSFIENVIQFRIQPQLQLGAGYLLAKHKFFNSSDVKFLPDK